MEKTLTQSPQQMEVEQYLRKNTPKGFGLCGHDFEHFTELFIKMNNEKLFTLHEEIENGA